MNILFQSLWPNHLWFCYRWCFSTCKRKWDKQIFCTNWLDVSNIGEWFAKNVRSYLIALHLLPSIGDGSECLSCCLQTWLEEATKFACYGWYHYCEFFLSSILRIFKHFLPIFHKFFHMQLRQGELLFNGSLLLVKKECCKPSLAMQSSNSRCILIHSNLLGFYLLHLFQVLNY
jgi:hypothetical protein